MRLIVMFDLPTKTKKDKREYVKFRNLLIKSGFTMLQYSVYVRFCVNRDVANKYQQVIAHNAPTSGLVRAAMITEKQMSDMKIITGEKTVDERTMVGEQLTFF